MSDRPDKALLVGVGRPVLTLLGTVPRLPAPGGQASFLSLSVQPSGAVPVALAVLLRWGYSARLVGTVSDDAFGLSLRQGLQAERLDLSTLTTAPGFVTPFSFDALEETETLRRTSFLTRGNLPPLPQSAVEGDILAGAAALLVDGTEPAAQVAAARKARERGLPVIFAAGDDPTAAHQTLVSLADVLVAAERFAAQLAPKPELEEALAALRAMGPRTAIVTLGPEGAVGADGGGVVRQPVFADLPVRDRRGAGDHFLAGVTHAVLSGWTLPHTLRFATAAAGLSCAEIGPLGVVPALGDVLALTDRPDAPATGPAE